MHNCVIDKFFFLLVTLVAHSAVCPLAGQRCIFYSLHKCIEVFRFQVLRPRTIFSPFSVSSKKNHQFVAEMIIDHMIFVVVCSLLSIRFRAGLLFFIAHYFLVAVFFFFFFLLWNRSKNRHFLTDSWRNFIVEFLEPVELAKPFDLFWTKRWSFDQKYTHTYKHTWTKYRKFAPCTLNSFSVSLCTTCENHEKKPSLSFDSQCGILKRFYLVHRMSIDSWIISI